MTINKERLLRLASRMEKVKAEHFDIGTWYDPRKVMGFDDLAEKAEFSEDKILLREGFCGSVACVLGHAALIPEFNNQGLGIKVEKGSEGMYPTIVYDGRQNTNAGAEFFGLSYMQASLLFGVGGRWREFYTGAWKEITPQHVAAALRRFVETDGESAENYL